MLDALYHSLDPIAFSIGPFAVRWYGLGYMFGFLLAAVLALRISKRWEIRLSLDGLLTVVIACILGTVLGGRLGYVLFYGDGYYFAHPDEIFAFSKGGMSFHGGLIGFAVGLIIAARMIRIPILTMGDIAAICTPIGLGLVRVANFINGELWGATTTLPWGVIFDRTGGGALPRHPTQLYEAALEGLILLLLLYLLARRRPPLPRGAYFGVFLTGYAVFRIAIEFVRQPDSQIGYLFGSDWITMGMMLSLPMIAVGAGMFLYAWLARRPQQGQLEPPGPQPQPESLEGAGDERDADSVQ
ncbi:MAG: prolipoprotein diacylglyceryl transferase [Coriobacteriales bacterium]|jgi:phosphatidylglycerol:prolipoprotein diacylglycerol transferase|nr:prolipoprotein diacylglyceryl transferase [Coriobacteriales bacterium]